MGKLLANQTMTSYVTVMKTVLYWTNGCILDGLFPSDPQV
jgi:hypothetical protein